MELYKKLGKKAYINKAGALFGKQVTITGVIDNNTFLVSCDWYDSTKLTTIEAQYLTILLTVNK